MRFNQILAAVMSAFFVMAPIHSNASSFSKAEFTVTYSDGSPAAGQTFKSKFEGVSRTTDEFGKVTLEVPSGLNEFEAKFYPDASTINLGLGIVPMTQIDVTSDVKVKIVLPEVLKTSVRVIDSNGQPVAHVPESLDMLNCLSAADLRVEGINKPLRFFVHPPRMSSRVETQDMWLSVYTNMGLRTIDGVAEIAMFKPTWPADCTGADIGADRVVDYTFKSATYQEKTAISGADLLSGKVTLIVPEAPKIEISLPIKLSDRNTLYNQYFMGTNMGKVSAAHPSILAKHLKFLNTVPAIGASPKDADSNGNFTLAFSFDKQALASESFFSVKTGLNYQSEPYPTPPRFNFLWRGQKLTIEAVGLTESMGKTKFKMGSKFYEMQAASNADPVIMVINNAEPLESLEFKNRVYSITSGTPTYFDSCESVWKYFQGGIAAGAKSKNKGVKVKTPHTVSSTMFKKVSRFDKDRDGIACER